MLTGPRELNQLFRDQGGHRVFAIDQAHRLEHVLKDVGYCRDLFRFEYARYEQSMYWNGSPRSPSPPILPSMQG